MKKLLIATSVVAMATYSVAFAAAGGNDAYVTQTAGSTYSKATVDQDASTGSSTATVTQAGDGAVGHLAEVTVTQVSDGADISNTATVSQTATSGAGVITVSQGGDASELGGVNTATITQTVSTAVVDATADIVLNQRAGVDDTLPGVLNGGNNTAVIVQSGGDTTNILDVTQTTRAAIKANAQNYLSTGAGETGTGIDQSGAGASATINQDNVGGINRIHTVTQSGAGTLDLEQDSTDATGAGTNLINTVSQTSTGKIVTNQTMSGTGTNTISNITQAANNEALDGLFIDQTNSSSGANTVNAINNSGASSQTTVDQRVTGTGSNTFSSSILGGSSQIQIDQRASTGTNLVTDLDDTGTRSAVGDDVAITQGVVAGGLDAATNTIENLTRTADGSMVITQSGSAGSNTVGAALTDEVKQSGNGDWSITQKSTGGTNTVIDLLDSGNDRDGGAGFELSITQGTTSGGATNTVNNLERSAGKVSITQNGAAGTNTVGEDDLAGPVFQGVLVSGDSELAIEQLSTGGSTNKVINLTSSGGDNIAATDLFITQGTSAQGSNNYVENILRSGAGSLVIAQDGTAGTNRVGNFGADGVTQSNAGLIQIDQEMTAAGTNFVKGSSDGTGFIKIDQGSNATGTQNVTFTQGTTTANAYVDQLNGTGTNQVTFTQTTASTGSSLAVYQTGADNTATIVQDAAGQNSTAGKAPASTNWAAGGSLFVDLTAADLANVAKAGTYTVQQGGSLNTLTLDQGAAGISTNNVAMIVQEGISGNVDVNQVVVSASESYTVQFGANNIVVVNQ